MSNRRIAVRIIVAILFIACFVGAACSAGEEIDRLDNPKIAVTLDHTSGKLTKIENRLTGETAKVDDAGFSIQIGTGTIPGSLGTFTPANCKLMDWAMGNGKVEYVFEKDAVRITVTYTLDQDDCFTLKKTRVDYSGTGQFNVNRLDMLDWSLAPQPAKAIPYYGYINRIGWEQVNDGHETPPSDNSTAFFLRSDKGGIFTALTCDFALMKDDTAQGRYRTTYWPGPILDAGTPFESEYAIIGVYAFKGLFFAPYESMSRLEDFRRPNVDVRLDRGEMDAMMSAVNKFAKPQVYMAIVNGWALGLPHLIESEEAVTRFSFAVDTLLKIPEFRTLHFVHSWFGLSREFSDEGMGMTLTPNPYAQQAFQYARDKGADLSTFIGVSNNWPAGPDQPTVLKKDRDLLSTGPDGKRRPKNIAAGKQYTDYVYDTMVKLREKYPNMTGFTRDFLWILPDYDTNHGYLAGRGSLYGQYRNLEDLDQRLRDRFPSLMLRGQMGYRDFGPWITKNQSFVHNASDPHMMNQRNFLDFHASYQLANNLRLACWFANNCRMLPRHKMNEFVVHSGSDFRAWDYGAWEYCVLSRIAVSTGFGMLNNLPDEPNGEVFPKEEGAFLKKWIDWQKAHQGYYTHERELFGEPRPTGVDGYSYGNGKDCIVFLCNPTFRAQSVAVPISDEIHLPAEKRYTIKELYPEERFRIGLSDGVFEYGSTFVLNVPAQTVMVFEIKPDDPSRPLLLGVQGTLASDANGFRLSNLSGPTGEIRTVAIRLPRGYSGSQKVPGIRTNRSGQLLLGQVKFGGERISPEVSGWRATKKNGRLKIKVSIPVPAVAREILGKQKLPVSKQFDTEEWRNRAGWLDWSRFIAFIPCIPGGIEVNTLKARNYEQSRQLLDSGTARLNGKTVPLRSNMMGTGSNARWSGYFVDASDSIRCGQVNELELDLPGTADEGFLGIYLPNLTRQMTSIFQVLSAPGRLETREMRQAADAFLPGPNAGVAPPKLMVLDDH